MPWDTAMDEPIPDQHRINDKDDEEEEEDDDYHRDTMTMTCIFHLKMMASSIIIPF